MTEAQLRRLGKQLRAGADGYAILSRAVAGSVTGNSPAIQTALANMESLGRELAEQAGMVENPPQWLREVKL